jgi:hypothetical protein
MEEGSCIACVFRNCAQNNKIQLVNYLRKRICKSNISTANEISELQTPFFIHPSLPLDDLFLSSPYRTPHLFVYSNSPLVCFIGSISSLSLPPSVPYNVMLYSANPIANSTPLSLSFSTPLPLPDFAIHQVSTLFLATIDSITVAFPFSIWQLSVF